MQLLGRIAGKNNVGIAQGGGAIGRCDVGEVADAGGGADGCRNDGAGRRIGFQSDEQLRMAHSMPPRFFRGRRCPEICYFAREAENIGALTERVGMAL